MLLVQAQSIINDNYTLAKKRFRHFVFVGLLSISKKIPERIIKRTHFISVHTFRSLVTVFHSV